MQSMSEFSQVWLDYIEGKVPIESVLAEIGTSGYDVTQGLKIFPITLSTFLRRSMVFILERVV